jgi:initiation factor 1A
MLGNGRVEVACFDGEKRIAHIRGKMRKKVRDLSRSSGSLLRRFSTRSTTRARMSVT